jgi:pyruvate decarboxylase
MSWALNQCLEFPEVFIPKNATACPFLTDPDYELAFLDLISENGLQFLGNPNELVASYAADGYARINGIGAFVTTFGPGELSAYCGVAGQFAEFVPVVHIVGYPAVTAQKAGAIMHHSLGDGKFEYVSQRIRSSFVRC